MTGIDIQKPFGSPLPSTVYKSTLALVEGKLFSAPKRSLNIYTRQNNCTWNWLLAFSRKVSFHFQVWTRIHLSGAITYYMEFNIGHKKYLWKSTVMCKHKDRLCFIIKVFCLLKNSDFFKYFLLDAITWQTWQHDKSGLNLLRLLYYFYFIFFSLLSGLLWLLDKFSNIDKLDNINNLDNLHNHDSMTFLERKGTN